VMSVPMSSCRSRSASRSASTRCRFRPSRSSRRARPTSAVLASTTPGAPSATSVACPRSAGRRVSSNHDCTGDHAPHRPGRLAPPTRPSPGTSPTVTVGGHRIQSRHEGSP
jgi:hypothetical protein